MGLLPVRWAARRARARDVAAWWLPVVLLALIGFSIGCGSSSESNPIYDPGDGGGGDDEPPILTDAHTGWKDPGCGGCHALPVEGHTQTQPGQCAPCHGGNGACDPNGENSLRQTHLPTDSCTGCHGDMHGFAAVPDCVACHFAAEGVDPACP